MLSVPSGMYDEGRDVLLCRRENVKGASMSWSEAGACRGCRIAVAEVVIVRPRKGRRASPELWRGLGERQNATAMA